jgi:hypothetical protein
LIILKPDGEILTLNGDEEFALMNTIEKWANGETIYWTREPENNDEHVWINISCNVCYMKPLVGLRFGCSDRECGYDLCQECYPKENTHKHQLIEFWSPKKIYSMEQMFAMSELINHNGEHITIKSLENKYIGLYFSAQWSVSNSSFTLDLSEVYRKAIELNLPFDIIFISGDNHQTTFDKQYEEMPWKALSFDNHIIQLQLKTYFSVNVIPTLVVLKPTGELLTKSGRKDIENKTIEAIQTWCKGERVKVTPEEFVWSSITCHGCGMTPLIGQRFHCKICSDYDLCSACKEKGHEHELVLISQPDNEEVN